MRPATVLLAIILWVLALPSVAGEIPGWHLSGSSPNEYSISLDRTIAYDGTTSGLLASSIQVPTGFGTLMQEAHGDLLKGRRVRLTAYVRSEGVKDRAGLWFRVDGTGDAPLAIDNMRDRPIKGDSDWTPYSIVLDVPKDATAIAYGVFLTGPGKLWLDSISWDVVTNLKPPTSSDPPAPTLPQMPFNLGFED